MIYKNYEVSTIMDMMKEALRYQKGIYAKQNLDICNNKIEALHCCVKATCLYSIC